MSEKRWKRNERAIAAILGGQRVPITGRKGADIAHPWLSVEVKSRETLPHWLLEAMMQATMAASPEQLPLVILHGVGQHHADDLVVMTLADFQSWFGTIKMEVTNEHLQRGRSNE
ncbi:MAG: hypothetical protein HY675_12790 [Chloroflexi bacterium]|nr:hypothetical protein [Chloroflexota bacterium]